MFDVSHLILIMMINFPAYICAGMALSRKIHDEEYYAASMFIVLMLLLIVDAVLVSQLFYVETYSESLVRAQAGISVLILPVLYMFLAPEGGEAVFNRTTIMLFVLTLLLLLPEMAWELIPGYAVTQYVEPQEVLGVSIFYEGRFVYHLYWAAVVVILQEIVSMSQMRRLYKMVTSHGAHYSWKARAAYYWDYTCGWLLAVSLLFPITVWQRVEMRWTYYIIFAAFIAVGCLLVFMGFDLNPIVIHQRKKLSLGDFMLETGDVVHEMRHMLEDDRVYLEKGLQSDTMAQRLDISHSYFLRMMQAVYNCSFPEYINNARVEYSKGLLRENKYSLEKIASLCGYSNTNAYIHLFKRVTGQTPYEWCHSDGYSATNDELLKEAHEEAFEDD